MKTKISRKTKGIALLYILAVVVLYLAIYVAPKVIDSTNTTQVLEPGVLTISSEAEGYLLKYESIGVADTTGTIDYKIADGTLIKNGTRICDIEKEEVKEEKPKEDAVVEPAVDGEAPKKPEYDGEFAEIKENYKDSSVLHVGDKAAISGTVSFTIDGGEKYFSPSNVEKITHKDTKDFKLKETSVNLEKVQKGDLIYKVSNDKTWYVVCWMDEEQVSMYQEGMRVNIKFPEGDVEASIRSITKEKGEYKVLMYSNRYYKAFANTRCEDITIIVSNTSGLIVDNDCIIEKNGIKGLYVVDKDKDYHFKPINIKATDGKKSAISDATFINDKYEETITVNVYDEVLKHPKKALEADLEAEKNEAKDEKK